MATNTYTAISTTTLAANTTTVTLSNLPQNYTDLVIVMTPASSSGTNGIRMRVGNGTVNTSSLYSHNFMDGNGSTGGSYREDSQTNNVLSYRLGINTSFTQFYTIQLMQYSNTNINKQILVRYNDGNTAVGESSLLWRSNSAIDTIAFNINSFGSSTGDFIAGSIFTVYGIKAEGPAPKATGGTIYTDAEYYYHVFGATGTFTPLQSLTADILVVAGGGGGSADMGGGGGAGGLLGFTSQSLTTTNYTCTVGAGGAGGASSGALGANGVNSQFGALTASVGGGRAGNYQTTSGASGGSGGGAGRGANSSGGAATSGQGYAGGNGDYTVADGSPGGGGGAGGVGGTGNSSGAGDGGTGSSVYSSWGIPTGVGQYYSGQYYLAGGGGGGWQQTTTVTGTGGLGGGGNGAAAQGVASTAAAANTGGGGGGGAGGGSIGRAGGSGVVIVRYLK